MATSSIRRKPKPARIAHYQDVDFDADHDVNVNKQETSEMSDECHVAVKDLVRVFQNISPAEPAEPSVFICRFR